MRTITIPETDTTYTTTLTFHHIFGAAFLGLGQLASRLYTPSWSKEAQDRYAYNPTCVQPALLRHAASCCMRAPKRDVKALVVCSIAAGNNIFDGISFCFTEDHYSRKTGEGLALRRAIQAAQKEFGEGCLPVEVRRVFWQAWLDSYRDAGKVWTHQHQADAVKNGMEERASTAAGSAGTAGTPPTVIRYAPSPQLIANLLAMASIGFSGQGGRR